MPKSARPIHGVVGLVGLVVVLAGCGGGGPVADQPAARPCVPRTLTAGYDGPPRESNTTLLGALAFGYELEAPAAQPRGVMLVIHGGGWVDVGAGQLAELRREVAVWLGRGWATANLDYRGCGSSLDDVVAAHDAIRNLVGPETPIAVVGESAGAQLGLLLAARRPDVAAVIAKAPPADAETLAAGRAYDPTTGHQDSPLPRELAAGWRGAFGDRWSSDFSPAAQAKAIHARVLLARGQHDPLIPEDQLTGMAEALRQAHADQWVETLDLEPGPVGFPHTQISAAGNDEYRAAELEAVAPWQTGPMRTPAAVPGWWPGPAGAAPAAAPAAPAPPPGS